MTLNARSLKNLEGVHPDLVAVVKRAAEITEVPFIVTEGRRSAERQAQLYAAGASKIKSGGRHETGHAVDLAALVAGEVRWDWPLYHKLADAMKKAAQGLRIPITWGGDWRTFKDGPHFELPRNLYP